MNRKKILGSLMGGAIGDTLGYEKREFFDTPTILENTVPSGAWEDTKYVDPRPLVSDDTQMTVFTAKALLSLNKQELLKNAYKNSSLYLLPHFTVEYLRWHFTQDEISNRRAPGGGCMRALKAVREGKDWWEATDFNAMGCGANMRVAPIGLVDLDRNSRWGLSMLSSLVTHGHAGALVSSALTAEAVWQVANGAEGRELLNGLLYALADMASVDFSYWLGDFWNNSEWANGFALNFLALDRVREVLDSGWKGESEPCELTGQGWIAPEALASALLCVVGLWDDPIKAVQRGAVSDGDSDSIAGIAGQIRGAAGVNWGRKWTGPLEEPYKGKLTGLAKQLAAC